MFTIEIEYAEARGVVEKVAATTPDEAYGAILSRLGRRCFVIADSDAGEFLIWLADHRAFVQVNEHREHYGTDPALRDADDAPVEFMEGYGAEGTMTVAFRETVTREQALAALAEYLDRRRMTPGLSWT